MEFDRLVKKRRSIRQFKPGGVTFKVIKDIVDAARWAMSPANSQPWLFVAVSSDSDKLAIREICEKNDPAADKRKSPDAASIRALDFLTRSPFLILVFGDREKPLWRESCWSAVTVISLQAAELGLGTFPYTPPRAGEIARIMNLAAKWRLIAILPVGEPDEFPTSEERPRRELDEVLKRSEDLPRMDHYTKMGIKKDESETAQYLRDSPVFSALTADMLDELSQLSTIQRLKKGDIVVRKGDPPGNFYIVADGMVEVLSGDASGNERVITFLGQGECFGEMSIISGEPVSATIRATGDLVLTILGMQDFLDIVDNNPQLNIFFTRLITRRLRKTNLQLVEESLMQGLTGRLSIISLPELVQAINISQKNGVLRLKNTAGEAALVYFANGQVIDVNMAGRSGNETFYALMEWPEGEFNFRQEDAKRARSVTMDTMGLLMEGMRRRDERARTAEKKPSAEKSGLDILDVPAENPPPKKPS
jgi:CRP-like cAMP-binding protein/nitroreductase